MQFDELAPNGRHVFYEYLVSSTASGSVAHWYEVPDAGGGPEGTWVMRAYAEDLAGNTSPWSNVLSVRYDLTAPATP